MMPPRQNTHKTEDGVVIPTQALRYVNSKIILRASLSLWGLFFSLSLATAAPCNLFSLIRDDNIDDAARCLNSGGSTLANTAADGGVTPLHLAAALDRADMITLLIAHGAWIDAPSAGGFTPLHWAAAEDATNALQRLLSDGANIAAVTDNGITPLHWAASRNATNCVRILLHAGLAVTAATQSGQTPLHWAVAQDAKESAMMLAFETVSEGLDLPLSNQVSSRLTAPPSGTNFPSTISVPQPDEPPHIGSSSRPPVVLRDAPLAHNGDTRTIDIGNNQQLTFIWIPSCASWMGACEISNGQFRQFRPSHDSGSRGALSLNGDDQPAVMVSWFDAQAFCKWLNTYYGHRMPPGMQSRLPTNDTWEQVARCGTSRRYPWGNEWPPLWGNHSDEAARAVFDDWKGIEGYDDGRPVSCAVTEAGTNKWGLCGLAGNVWEWCDDWYDSDAHQLKVRKGGGWDFEDPVSLEINTRGFDTPDSRYDTIGFRVVLERFKK